MVSQFAFMGRNAEQNKEMRARTRSKILDAAREVFGSKGFDASRIEDIVQYAQVAKGLFYEHFNNKEDVEYYLNLPLLASIPETDFPYRKA